MDPQRPPPGGPRPGALSDLEARLLAAKVGGRLFQRPAEPVQLGRYRLRGRIGQGGMSVVFRAEDPQLRREVAVKLLHSPRGQPDPEQQARLRREAHALGRLSHPNVVQVFEIGEADGQTFVVMELVRGTTLREWLRERPRTPAEVAAIAAQAGRGLAAAHAAGIVHRDFKPENVLVGEDGRARVVDFGLARANPDAPVEASTGSLGAPLTRSGTVLGTPAFMAPEQLRDPGRADARSDQYSFCVLVYEALYGERPFDEAASVRPAPAGSAVPPWLREALLRGLRADPAERWPNLDELLAALDRAAETVGDTASRAKPSTTPGSTPRRRRALWLGGLALALAMGAAGGAWLARRGAPGPDERAAVVEQQLAALLAAEELGAAERMLAVVPDPDAGRAYSRWARMLAEAGRGEAGVAWAHAYVLAGDDAPAREQALLGLAQAYRDAREGAQVLAWIEAEAPALASAPELVKLREAVAARDSARTPGGGAPPRDQTPRDSAPPPDSAPSGAPRQGEAPLDSARHPDPTPPGSPRPSHSPRGSAQAPDARSPVDPTRLAAVADRLADAGVPREVVALARAGLPQLAAATLRTLADRAGAPTRQTWQLAAAAIHDALGDQARALALAIAAADEPTMRPAALTEQAALLLASGRVEEAARALAQPGASAGDAAAALRDRIAALLAARTRVSLRFTGATASPWTELEPAALRGDPADHALVVTGGDLDVLASWPLELRADRLLVDLALEPTALAPGALLGLRVSAGEASVQLALHVADDGTTLRLSCESPPTSSTSVAPSATADIDASATARRSLTLQLDVDPSRGAAICRVLDADRAVARVERAALSGRWSPGPARLELRGGAAGTQVRLTELVVLGAVPAALASPSPQMRAGALLVDGDAHAAAAALAGLDEPRARLWQALALARLGRSREAAPLLERALADDSQGLVAAELPRWLRGDPERLGPALRDLLGERRYLALFARTWRTPLDAPQLAPEIVRVVLAGLDGVDERCDDADECAELRRAYGRALAQIGEPARARQALSAALAAAPDDPAGRALASRLVLDLALVQTPRARPGE